MMNLQINKIEDKIIRDNFEKIQAFEREQHILQGKWQFMELTFAGAVANQKERHPFNFVPKDVIITSTIGAGSITFNYGNFDNDFLDITTTGAVTVRFFVGTYVEGSSA